MTAKMRTARLAGAVLEIAKPSAYSRAMATQWFGAGVICLLCLTAQPASLRIESAATNGQITWSGAYTAGVCTVQTAAKPEGPWAFYTNQFTSNTFGSARISLSPSNTFCKLASVDISTNSPLHYTNLLQSYGGLETIAGRGRTNIDSSQWSNSFEGAWATNVDLSRPHIAFGDPWGNVLIVDQRSSSVLKVTPEGRLFAYAGTHTAGNNGDGPAFATNLHLNNPNGGWMRSDGTFYILDTENGKVRKVATNGIMTTLFTTAPMGDGRAFWVKSDESLVYFGSGPTEVTTLNKWTPTGGVSVVRTGFGDMGNILGDERTGDLYITDRNANRVYRMDTNLNLIPIAGNGYQTNSIGGGEGGPALLTGLTLPRSIWFIPNGGYFLSEHDPGNRIWYVDPAGNIHRWMNGSSANNKRVGDGQWFYANPNLAKVSRVRSVNTDPFGNLIIVESNYGYVRRIKFERLFP
jgi:hypothetical protein